jgi:hypothetical protein
LVILKEIAGEYQGSLGRKEINLLRVEGGSGVDVSRLEVFETAIRVIVIMKHERHFQHSHAQIVCTKLVFS